MSVSDTNNMTNVQALCLYLAIVAVASFLFIRSEHNAKQAELEYQNMRYSLIQLDAMSKNESSILAMKKAGITLPEEIYSIDDGDPHYMFPKGVPTNYGEFETVVLDTLQPASLVCPWSDTPEELETCKLKRMENVTLILSYSALGKYQILLIYHGKYMDGWEEAGGAERLGFIHRFMVSSETQDYVFSLIISKLADENGGDPDVMAAAYYSGSGAELVKKRKKQGAILHTIAHPIETYRLYKGQTGGGYGSISKYSKYVGDCYRVEANKETVETIEDLDIFGWCISEKESGGTSEEAPPPE